METAIPLDVLGTARRIVKYCTEQVRVLIDEQKKKLPNLDRRFEFIIENENEDIVTVAIKAKDHDCETEMLHVSVWNMSGELMNTTDTIVVLITSTGFNDFFAKPETAITELDGGEGQLKHIVSTAFHNTLFKVFDYDSLSVSL